MHGCVAFCSEVHRLVKICLDAWQPHEELIREWRSEASKRDRFLLGKLVLPRSLVGVLITKVGWRETKRVIFKFQSVVVDRLDNVLKGGWRSKGKRKRPCVFVEDDWRGEHDVMPRHAKTMRR